MKSSRLPLYLTLLMLVASCTQDDATPSINTTAQGWIIPTVGTQYVYKVTSQFISSDTGTPTQYPPIFDTQYVLAVRLPYRGKTDVVEMCDNSDTTFLHYESNGDLFMVDSRSGAASWSLYPSSGGSTISDPVTDTTRPDGTHILQTLDRSFIAQEQLALGFANYGSSHVRESAVQSATNTRMNDADTSFTTTDFWFVPELGNYAKQRILRSDHSRSGATKSFTGVTSDVELVGYYPK